MMKTIISFFCGVLLVSFLVSLLGAFFFKFLWNYAMPIVWSGAPILTFWQAFGIMYLILFIRNLIGGSDNAK